VVQGGTDGRQAFTVGQEVPKETAKTICDGMDEMFEPDTVRRAGGRTRLSGEAAAQVVCLPVAAGTAFVHGRAAISALNAPGEEVR